MSETTLPETRLFALGTVRRTLVTCAAALTVALGVWAAGAWMAVQQKAQVDAALAQRDAVRAALREAGTNDGAQPWAAFAELHRRGVFEPPDVVAWIEALNAAAAQLSLPAPGFELGPRQPPDADGAPAYYDLRFRVARIHEDELLALLDGVARRSKHALRVQGCAMSRMADDAGIEAQCTLRWFAFDAATAPGTEVPAR